MRKINLITLLIALFLFACGTEKKETTKSEEKKPVEKPQTKAENARPTHWGYEGEDGPSNWGKLDPVYAECGNGTHQSPINIVKTNVEGGVTLHLNYKSIPSFTIAHTEHMEEIIDNGHTIQVSVDEGSTISVDGKSYDLKQFHFHTPSEHTVDGKHMPMEMHMVHQSDDKNLAVVSLLFTEGSKPNANFEKIVGVIPDSKGESKHVTDTELDIKSSLPEDNFVYHYIGSLTTPPCSENVQWLVMRDMVSLSADQINAFSSRIGDNNRPVQPLNDREVNMDDLSLSVD